MPSCNIKGWGIHTIKKPISNASEIERDSKQVNLPLPEIYFGNNALVIKGPSHATLQWTALDALRDVRHEAYERVAYANEWAAKAQTSEHDIYKNYDWTYTTTHTGTFLKNGKPLSFSPASEGIPFSLLARTDIPIDFYDEVHFYEDELGDNGISNLMLRVRANQYGVFILQRFFSRIDNLKFRLFDTRVYVDFDSARITRDCRGIQVPYSYIKDQRPPNTLREDLRLLMDTDWVARMMQQAHERGNDEPWPGALSTVDSACL